MDFRLPELGEGVYEAELADWRVQPGDKVRHGQPLLEVMTDKATMEVPSPFSGTVSALNARPGDQVQVGQVMLTYESKEHNGIAHAKPVEQNSPAPVTSPPKAESAPIPRTGELDTVSESGAEDGGKVLAAPSVRRLARSKGIDLATIHGSGPGGRILLEDLNAPAKFPTRPATSTSAVQPATEVPKSTLYGQPGTTIPMRGLRRTIAERMVQSLTTIPQATYVEEVDVTQLVHLKHSLQKPFLDQGVRLTYLPFFVKAAVAALKQVPILNASLREESQEIRLHDEYHIGIATATPKGLLVPVVQHADRLSLGDISREIDTLSKGSREGTLPRQKLTGSTFTITSIGNLGGMFSTPMVNPPEVAILGLGKIVKRPVYDEHDNLRPAHLLYLSLSFDHRVLDGDAVATFCNAIKEQLHSPLQMLVPDLLGK